MAELVQNRSQRLHFDVSSPNGILLFRVTSEMIVAYGMNVTDLNVQLIVSHTESMLFKMQLNQDKKGGQSQFLSPQPARYQSMSYRATLCTKAKTRTRKYELLFPV